MTDGGVHRNEIVAAILTDLRCRFERLYENRLARMVLSGSQARGDAQEGSDVDVLVVLKGLVAPSEEISRTIGDVADLSLAHDVVVSCVFRDEDRFMHRNGPLLRNIRREGIPL